MKYYPMKLRGVCKNAIWGGQRLITQYGKGNSAESVAESWELTLRGEDVSTIENGIYKGMALDRFFSLFPSALGTDIKGNFPLLIKLIDAKDDLSVQVHPNDAYAALHEHDIGKSEMWYVIDAEDDAEIIYGSFDGTDKEKLCRALIDGKYDDVLRRIHVSAGDVFYIPAGQIHALGHGTLIAEIQQNSDITYRIFDYNRIGSDGKARELHTKKALDVSYPYTSAEIKEKQYSSHKDRRPAPEMCKTITDCEYFRVCKLESHDGHTVSFTIDEKAFAALIFTSADDTTVFCGGVSACVFAGDTFFIPAGSGTVTLCGNFNALFAEV